MGFLRTIGILAVFVTAAAPALSLEFHNAQLETQVEALFAGDRDMAEIKLTIDRMVEPDIDVAAGLGIIDGMADDIERMRAAAGATSDFDKVAVLRRYLYEPGPWNGGKVFSYDPDDPLGRKPKNQLLSDYLADRKGNCVSMPTLMMVLGNRIGLKMTLAHAPYHNLVKFTGGDGREWNLEATSGGGFTRESHYRKLMPDITDEAVKSGIYLRGLPRAELIATTVSGMLVSRLMEQGRLEDALAVADRLLKHAPDSMHLKLTRASILTLFIRRDVVSKYKTMEEIPPDVLAYADDLYRQNEAAFDEAERLGWREPAKPF
jgi:regulator of sirC expression with transglutaminase-like and TPR domain